MLTPAAGARWRRPPVSVYHMIIGVNGADMAVSERKWRLDKLARRRRRTALTAAAALLFATAAGSSTLAQSDDFGDEQDAVAFTELPTSALLELYTDVGEVLQARDLVSTDWNPARLYAEQLAIDALSLKRATTSRRLEGPGGVDYAVLAARLNEPQETPLLRNLDALAESPPDRLVLVLFQRDFQVDAAVVLPRDVIAGAIVNGAMSVTQELLSEPAVETITPRLVRFASENFE